jgi:hypothetical protein
MAGSPEERDKPLLSPYAWCLFKGKYEISQSLFLFLTTISFAKKFQGLYIAGQKVKFPSYEISY